MRKHGALEGNQPNPSWIKRSKKSQARSKAARKACKRNR